MAARIAGLYDMEDTLGSGHFAVVKSAKHVFTGLRVAIKVIDKLKLDEVSKAHLYQEVRCMKMVSHPSIIRLYEVIDTQTKLYLIEELGDGGDLYDFIMKHPSGVEDELAKHIFKQAVSAIRYCHQLHIVHRDLKPENLVLCTSNGVTTVKLTDFGLSRTFMPGEMIESSCGSLEYSAPEILLGDSYDPPKVDVWSLGVILFMLISGRSPFAYGGANETLTHIMDGKYDIPVSASDTCRSLIKKMLVVNASQRIRLEDVVHHEWLQGVSDQEVTSLLPLTLNELHPSEVANIVHRMQQGGYGDEKTILMAVQDYPYGSIAATFYMLAEAERHRKMFGAINTSALVTRKISLQPSIMTLPIKSRGHAETGVLLPRRGGPRAVGLDVEPLRRVSGEPIFTSPKHDPYQNPQYSSPRLGVGGEQVSASNMRKPSFPIQSVAEDTSQVGTTEDMSPLLRLRQLSACEEEIEIDEPPLIISPRSRSRILSLRGSPSFGNSVSKSDGSEEEEEDDIVELCTASTYISRGSIASRHSPTTSPRLSTRRSPSHTWAYSSDEESSESRRKRHGKRLRRYRKLKSMVRVDSASSDDSSDRRSEKPYRHSMPSFGRLALWSLSHNRSTPTTPGECSGSESFSEFLSIRRPRSHSAHTDSSHSDARSDTGDLIATLSSRCQLSDGEDTACINYDGADEMMEINSMGVKRKVANSKVDNARIKDSVLCKIL